MTSIFSRLQILFVALVAATLSGVPARAEAPVMVELFTSQGCSSCPPADTLLAQIAERDDVIALALHVDYWDYIGWKDIFADPAFTKRQKLYAYAAKSRSVYTPQMIVGGRDHIVGHNSMELADLIAQHKSKPRRVAIDLERRGDRLSIDVEALDRLDQGNVLRVAFVNPGATVEIKRGENAGRRLTYRNIVEDLVDVATWDGRGRFEHTISVPPGLDAVVFVQEKGMGPILGAARAD